MPAAILSALSYPCHPCHPRSSQPQEIRDLVEQVPTQSLVPPRTQNFLGRDVPAPTRSINYFGVGDVPSPNLPRLRNPKLPGTRRPSPNPHHQSLRGLRRPVSTPPTPSQPRTSWDETSQPQSRPSITSGEATGRLHKGQSKAPQRRCTPSGRAGFERREGSPTAQRALCALPTGTREPFPERRDVLPEPREISPHRGNRREGREGIEGRERSVPGFARLPG
jgi:hypothetical protein